MQIDSGSVQAVRKQSTIKHYKSATYYIVLYVQTVGKEPHGTWPPRQFTLPRKHKAEQSGTIRLLKASSLPGRRGWTAASTVFVGILLLFLLVEVAFMAPNGQELRR